MDVNVMLVDRVVDTIGPCVLLSLPSVDYIAVRLAYLFRHRARFRTTPKRTENIVLVSEIRRVFNIRGEHIWLSFIDVRQNLEK